MPALAAGTGWLTPTSLTVAHELGNHTSSNYPGKPRCILVTMAHVYIREWHAVDRRRSAAAPGQSADLDLLLSGRTYPMLA
jgi:hypothetical protein